MPRGFLEVCPCGQARSCRSSLQSLLAEQSSLMTTACYLHPSMTKADMDKFLVAAFAVKENP